jgi:hypothetical protein
MTGSVEREASMSGDGAELWRALTGEERTARFRELPRREAEELFLSLPAPDQAEVLDLVPAGSSAPG